MEIKFTPTVDDVLKLQRAVSATGWYTFLFVLLLVLMFLVGIFLVDHDLALIGWLWLAMSVALAVGLYEVPRFKARRAFASAPSVQGEINLSLDDKGTTWTFPTGSSHREWRGYIKHKETRGFLLLYVSDAQYQWIPKRAMSASEVEELRKLLADHSAKS